MTTRAGAAIRRGSQRKSGSTAAGSAPSHKVLTRCNHKVFAWCLAPGESERVCVTWAEQGRARQQNAPYHTPVIKRELAGPWLAVDVQALVAEAGIDTPRATGLEAVRPWLTETRWEDATMEGEAWVVVPAPDLSWSALTRTTRRHSTRGVTIECDGWSVSEMCFWDENSTVGFGMTIAPFLTAWAMDVCRPTDAARWWKILRAPGVCSDRMAAAVLTSAPVQPLWTMTTTAIMRDLLNDPDPTLRTIAVAHLHQMPGTDPAIARRLSSQHTNPTGTRGR